MTTPNTVPSTKSGESMSDRGSTIDMFLQKALEQILKLAGRRDDELKKECEATILSLGRLLPPIPPDAAAPSPPLKELLPPAKLDALANKIIPTLRLAIKTGTPTIVGVALDTIHKLLVYNCIRSDCVDTSSSNARLTDTVIELISACFEIGEKDEAVQLQIIKALLTAITSPVCGVHEESLMTAVRTSYNIYLISQSQINRRTAKATLTQMLHLIFQRMEAHGAARLQNSATRASTSDNTSAARSSHGSSSSSPSSSASPPSLSSSSSQPIVPQDLSGSEDSSSAEIDPALGEFGDGDGIPPPAQADDEDEIPVPTEGDPIAAEAIAEIVEEAEADLLVEDGIEGGSSQSVEITQPEPTFQPEPTLQPESTLQPEASIPANPSEGVGSALPTEEAASSMGPPPPPPHRNAPPNSEEHSESLIYTDCFLIFRALCKLSVTDVPKGFADPSSIDMRSKVLSLELLLTVLEGAGPVLRSHRKFIAQAIKKYLCISLLTNGVSPVPKIFQLSLSIFWALLSSFKENLKNEIGIFFKKIFLPLLESPHSTVQQKWMVLQILLKICRIPQTLLELFVNYDCSSDPNNLVFEPMVRDIAAIAKGTPTIDTWTTPAQDAKMRTMGLECLVAIARSLVSWSNELMSDAHDENLNASLVAAGGAAAAAANAAADASKKPPSSSAPRSDDAVRSADDKSEDEIEQSCAAPSTSTSPVDPQKKADPIEEQLRHNQQLRRGFELFNRRPKRGLEFLIKIGHITSEPPSIARLLRSERSLEKATVGDFLGGHDAFNVSVMYAYVDLFSFAGMTLDMAIRNFLAEFRLPKEAKQIDRIMEKFASRFYEDNCPTPHFANATSAFVLAFAVIMLATDLHSPAIVKKITKPEWRNMLRGQNDNQDFPAEFLDPMYERVGSAPLKVNRDDKTIPKVAPSGGFMTPKNRLQLFHQETLEMIQKSRAELKENLSADADPLLGYFVSPELHHVRPIFEVCWGAMLAAFGQLLESSDDQNAINLCLEGFRLAIRIAGIFYLETPRASFINALRKFSLLDSTMVRRHRLQRKNVDSIVTLLELALTDGNYFQSSWGIVLECISQLDRLSTLTTFGIHSDTELQSPEPLAAGDKAKQQRLRKPASADPRQAAGAGRSAPSRSPGIPPSSADLTDDAPSSLASYFGGDNPGERARREAELAASIEAHNASIVTHSIDVSMIDKIFSHTVKLNGDAIVEFVQALCEVSVREIANPKGPRLFSLRKIVEVASFNMDRIRLIWSRVWSHLSAHFEKVGCDDRLTVAMYAIDSLRQLAMKFLEKDELANFSFQHLFLKPFDYISQNTNSSVIRELIIRCLTQMVSARARNLLSGWRSILSVLTAESEQQDATIVTLAFDLAKSISTEHLRNIAEHGFFQDCVRTLTAYGNSTLVVDIALAATTLLGECAQQLMLGTIPAPSDDPEPMAVWFPILTGLAGIAIHPVAEVRIRSLRTLFAILQEAGSRFSARDWDVLCRGILFPIFDNVRYVGDLPSAEKREENEWVNTTAKPALSYFVSLFSWFFEPVSPLLDECLCLLTACILQENEQLASIGTSVFAQLIMNNNPKWTRSMWDLILYTIDFQIQKNSPREILSLIKLKASTSVGDSNTGPTTTTTAPAGASSSNPALTSGQGPPPTGGGDPTQEIPRFPPIEEVNLASDLESFNLRLSRSAPLGLRKEEQKSALLFLKMIRVRCQVQGMLVSVASTILDKSFSLLHTTHLLFILNLLQRSFEFFRSVNCNDSLWALIPKTNLRLDFIRQEYDVCRVYLGFMFKMFSTPSEDVSSAIESRLLTSCLVILADYNHVIGTDHSQSPYAKSKLSIVTNILTEIYHFPDAAFHKCSPFFFKVFAMLISATSRKLRSLLSLLFIRIGISHRIILQDHDIVDPSLFTSTETPSRSIDLFTDA